MPVCKGDEEDARKLVFSPWLRVDPSSVVSVGLPHCVSFADARKLVLSPGLRVDPSSVVSVGCLTVCPLQIVFT